MKITSKEEARDDIKDGDLCLVEIGKKTQALYYASGFYYKNYCDNGFDYRYNTEDITQIRELNFNIIDYTKGKAK